MADRFFLTNPVVDGIATLDEEQARHAVHVMRYSIGDSVNLFDGAGREFKGKISAIQNKSVLLVIEETRNHTRYSGPVLTLAAALPKGDRQRFLIEKLVELGVDRFVPLRAERSVSVANSNVLDRFRKWTIEACKQCERNFLMEISPEQTVTALVDESIGDVKISKYVADPRAEKQITSSNDCREIVVAIGPEGGFTESELEFLLSSGWKTIRMGDAILRTETAAVYAAVVFGRMKDER